MFLILQQNRILKSSIAIIFVIIILLFNQTKVIGVEISSIQNENTAIRIGDVYRFKYEIVRLNDSSEKSNVSIIGLNATGTLVFKENEILNMEITNFTRINNIDFIEALSYNENDSISQNIIQHSFTINFIYLNTNNVSYYEERYNYFNNILKSDYYKCKMESDHFFLKSDRDLLFVDKGEHKLEIEEIYIPLGITCSYELKITSDEELEPGDSYYRRYYNHLKITSLDYPPLFDFYDNGDGLAIFSDILKIIEEIIQDPVFFIILFELGILVVLIRYFKNRKKVLKN